MRGKTYRNHYTSQKIIKAEHKLTIQGCHEFNGIISLNTILCFFCIINFQLAISHYENVTKKKLKMTTIHLSISCTLLPIQCHRGPETIPEATGTRQGVTQDWAPNHYREHVKSKQQKQIFFNL